MIGRIPLFSLGPSFGLIPVQKSSKSCYKTSVSVMYCNTYLLQICKFTVIFTREACRLCPGPVYRYTQALLNCIEILRIFLFLLEIVLHLWICHLHSRSQRHGVRSLSLSLPAIHTCTGLPYLRYACCCMAPCTSNLHICICPGAAPPTFCCRIPASLLPRSHTQ